MLFVVIDGIENCHSDNQEVTQDTQSVGCLTEKEEPDHSGENNLRIVIDTDFPSGGVGIGGGDGELTARAAQTAADEHTQLIGCGHYKFRSHQRKYGHTGEAGEKQHNHGAEGTALCGTAQTGIGSPCGNTAQQTDQRGKQLQIFPCGFDNA